MFGGDVTQGVFRVQNAEFKMQNEHLLSGQAQDHDSAFTMANGLSFSVGCQCQSRSATNRKQKWTLGTANPGRRSRNRLSWAGMKGNPFRVEGRCEWWCGRGGLCGLLRCPRGMAVLG